MLPGITLRLHWERASRNRRGGVAEGLNAADVIEDKTSPFELLVVKDKMRITTIV